jgi:hypothetical protein
MSISASAAAALQQVNFNGHRRKSGGANASGAGSSIGALPVGAGQNLLSNAIQSLKQTVSAVATPGSASAVGATGAVGASGATRTAQVGDAPGSSTIAPLTQDVQGFLHSLFAALKQDGLGSAAPAGPATPATATATASVAATLGTTGTAAAAGASATATSATGSVGQYQGSLVSALQTLIQQIGGNSAGTGAGSGATRQLTDSFSKLTAAAGGSGSSTTIAASTTQLKNFLSNLLQNLQSGGGQLSGLVGTHVNANA